MSNELLQQLVEAKKSNEVAYVSFFNDGNVRTDTRDCVYRLKKDVDNEYSIIPIIACLKSAVESYSDRFDFDTVSMRLSLGLIYEKDDVLENNQIKSNAMPLKNIVRYYTDKIDSYLNGKKTNTYDYNEIMGRQGFINFNTLISLLRDGGLNYYGPNTFEEFKNLVLSGVPFDIYLQANLKQYDDNKELTKKR